MDAVVRSIVETHWKRLSKMKNVRGYSGTLKPRLKDGKIVEGTRCFRIYVTKKARTKEEIEALGKENLIPRQLSILEGIFETDVVEIGEIRALEEDPKKRYRPVVAGVSAMHFSGTACTVNFFYKDRETGQILVASNNHCFYMENTARPGDPILQPSPYDGGNVEGDKIGGFYKGVEISFDEFKCPYRNSLYRIYRFFKKSEQNKVDIAFATLDVEYVQKILNIGAIYSVNYTVNVGDYLQKMGRTTGLTKDGLVIDVDWNGQVGYSRGTATFTDCILIQKTGFSAGGDSGSPVLTQEDEPKFTGALFAGSDTHTIVCKIGNIEDLAGVELIFPNP